jgi:putative Mg2+ transporter-C (MgtC) family protein
MNIETLVAIDPFDWKSIGTAILCGTIIGMERQLRGKPIGIRTSSLIILGTYLFIASTMEINTEHSDPSRIIGQIVTGIGFLGAGVMLSKEGVVIGATSAATIWALAAIGVCVAVISAAVAIKFSILVLIILLGMDWLEDYSTALTKGVHSKVIAWRKGG